MHSDVDIDITIPEPITGVPENLNADIDKLTAILVSKGVEKPVFDGLTNKFNQLKKQHSLVIEKLKKITKEREELTKLLQKNDYSRVHLPAATRSNFNPDQSYSYQGNFITARRISNSITQFKAESTRLNSQKSELTNQLKSLELDHTNLYIEASSIEDQLETIKYKITKQAYWHLQDTTLQFNAFKNYIGLLDVNVTPNAVRIVITTKNNVTVFNFSLALHEAISFKIKAENQESELFKGIRNDIGVKTQTQTDEITFEYEMTLNRKVGIGSSGLRTVENFSLDDDRLFYKDAEGKYQAYELTNDSVAHSALTR